jgi:hypothetical protein
MGALQICTELVLIGLLAGNLLFAIRLERARGGIKQDRDELVRLIRTFDDSNRQAEAGAERLRVAADAAGRAMARQLEGSANLKDDLVDLIERGERLSSRIGGAVRNDLEPTGLSRIPQAEPEMAGSASPRLRSQAERELLRALRVTR